MFDQYKIAVKLALTDELTAPLALVSARLRMTEEAAGKLHARMASMKAFFAGGMGLIGAGATLAAPLLYAVDKAAQLQKQIIAVQIATRGTVAEMTSMRSVIEGVAAKTVFSNVDVAKMAKQVATGTGLNAAQVQSILPAYVKYADVQFLLKDTPYSQSITDAIRAAHTAQHYDAASLTEYLNLLTKASLIVPGSVSEVVRGLAYFQGIAKTALGVNDENAVLAVAMANRLGFAGTRGGTNLAAAFTRTIPGVFGSGLLTGKSNVALTDMGMVDAHGHAKVFENGKFSVLKWMGLTADFVAREFANHPEAIARQRVMEDFQHAYGTVGGRAPAMMGSPQAIEQWKQLAAQFQEYGGFEGMQQKFADESVAQQYMNAKTNFASAMTELGITLLPEASRALKKLNIYLGELIAWMNKNPEKVHQYAKNFAELAAALVGLGVVSVATSAIIGLRNVLTMLGSTANTAAAATTGFGRAMSAIARVGTAGALGYAVGTVAYDNYVEGTKLDDWLGEQGAKFMASFFRSQAAKDALAAHHVKGYYTAPQAGLHAGSLAPASDFSQSIAPPKSPLLNTTNVTNVYLDGKLLTKVVNGHNSKALSAPQTGPSLFDSTLMPVPAGGLGF